MRAWRHLLGGLLLWTVHFFAVYGIASVLPGTRAAVILVLIVTAAAFALAVWQFFRTMRVPQSSGDKLQQWMRSLAALGYALAAAAIAYQGLATLLS